MYSTSSLNLDNPPSPSNDQSNNNAPKTSVSGFFQCDDAVICAWSILSGWLGLLRLM